MEINATKIRNTGQKGVHYMPTMRLRDNKRIGYSYASDGTTQAKGTLYPYNANNAAGTGSVSSMYATEHTAIEDFDLDYDSYTNNEVKYKTAEDYFQLYKKSKGLSLGFLQQQLTILSGVFNTSGKLIVLKMHAVTSSVFTIVYAASAGTTGIFAVAGSVNTTTGAITLGTPVQLSTTTGLTNYGTVDFVEINTAKYAVVFQQTATTMRTIIYTISGTTVTAGTAVDVTITSTTINSSILRVVKVDTDKFLTCYYASSSNTSLAFITTVAGTVPSSGTVTSLFGGTTNRMNPIVNMGSTTSGLFFCINGSNYPFVQAFTLSGTTFTLGSELQLNSNGWDSQSPNGVGYTLRVLPNGVYYYCNLSNSGSHEYYISVSGTTATLASYRIGVTTGTSFNYASQEWYIDANEWCFKVYDGAQSLDVIMCFKYDTTTQKVNVTKREMLEQLAAQGLQSTCVGKVGSQYIIIAGSIGDSASPYYYVAQEGSAELYFEAEGTAFATVTSAKYGWSYSRQSFTKTINRVIAYLSIKNKTGNTVIIRTRDWLFEVI